MVAQFVAITQTEPFSNPASVCAGGVMTFRLNSLQNLNSGSIIKMELSNVGGTFPGIILTTIEYSFDNITYIPGDFIWTSNIVNSFIRVNIPFGAILGAGYNARAVSSSPNITGIGNNNSITITPPIVTIPTVAQNTYGIGEWFGHVYSWTPTTGSQLNTPALVAAQSFFSSTNYKGHVVKNSLSFDDNFLSTGFLGSASFYNQSSVGCGNNLISNFAIRYMRNESFTPGRYTISIQCEDGMRLSIDGGATWLLDSYVEQQYASSFKTTATANPSGICLGGSTNIVIEYFQNPANAHATVSFTQLSSNVNNPLNQTICASSNASFDATCTDAGATYQWQIFNSVTSLWVNLSNAAPYSGSASSTLNISNAPLILNGAQYRCLVSNSCPAPVSSTTATLTVTNSSNSFTTQPISTTVCATNNTNFSATFSGGSPTYQWLYSTDGGLNFNNVPSNANFSGTNTATLSLTNVPISFNNYQFVCSCVGSCGSNVLSSAAILTVGTGIGASFTTQPTPTLQIICIGDDATINVTATTANIFWQLSTDGGITFNDINSIAGLTGETSSTLAITDAPFTMNGWVFRCRIISCGNNLFSNNSTLVVGQPQVITTQPTLPNPFCPGGNATISLTATNADNYEWHFVIGGIDNILTDNSIYSGTNTNTLIISNIPSGLTGSFLYCKVFGCNSNTPTNTITVNYTPPQTITQQPNNQTICPGANASFTVAASSTNVSYNWYMSTNMGATFTQLTDVGNVSGSNTNTLIISNCTLANNNNQFYCSVLDVCNTPINSNAASIIIDSGTLNIIAQPETQLACEGESTFYNCTTSIIATYQWQVNDGSGFVNIINNQNFSGATTNTLAISDVPFEMNGNIFKCIIISCAGSIATDEASLYVIPKPIITVQPKSINLCSNQTGTCNLNTAGSGLTYQWQNQDAAGNYINIELSNSTFLGATTNQLLILSSTNTNTKKLRCIVSNSCSSITSNEIVVTIIKPPQIISQPTSDSICESKSNNYTFNVSGDSLTFTWYLAAANTGNFIPIKANNFFDSTATSTIYLKDAPIELNGAKMFCVVKSCSQGFFSDTIDIKIKSKKLNFYIPTAFTPNGDNINEVLEFVGIKNTEIQGIIYDRWGQSLFTFSKFNPIWDGTFNGNDVSTGLYDYVITNQGKGCSNLEVKGYVSVIR